MMRSSAACLLVLAACVPATAGEEGLAPDRVPGLAAWYTVDALNVRHKNGEPIRKWPDASGNGRDLISEDKQPPYLEAAGLNEQPVVHVRKGNVYQVADPFELGDHTIFLVFKTKATDRALLRSDRDPMSGIVLNLEGRTHYFRGGGSAPQLAYNKPQPTGKEYGITVLGREAGLLTAFINGVERSSSMRSEAPLRVAQFFHIDKTKFVSRDGEGLSFAEMIFYERHLTEPERESVTAYLADRYAIAVDLGPTVGIDEESVRVRLTSDIDKNLNEEAVFVEWTGTQQLDAPFKLFDREGESTALRCERDGTRARLAILLPVVATVPDAALRLLILKNGQEYHPHQTTSDPFEGDAEKWRGKLQLQTTISLDAGDFIEIIVARDGAEGEVKLDGDEARLLVAQVN